MLEIVKLLALMHLISWFSVVEPNLRKTKKERKNGHKINVNNEKYYETTEMNLKL